MARWNGEAELEKWENGHNPPPPFPTPGLPSVGWRCHQSQHAPSHALSGTTGQPRRWRLRSVLPGFSLLCPGSVLSPLTGICRGASSRFAYCSPGISRDACTRQYLQGNIKLGMLRVIYSAACRAINSVRLLLKRHKLRKWAEGLRDRGGWTQAVVVVVAAENPVFLAANSTDVISESARSKTNLV